ncbi:MAG: GAF domain-containing protein, partial [Myxococcales bacterium]|nr:GAF domain-containing protein [Myxococcales bacterium]
MATLVHAALAVRKTTRSYYGVAAAIVVAGACVAGVFEGAIEDPRPWPIALGMTWLAAFATRATVRFRDQERGRTNLRADIELSLLLLAAVHAVVQLGGGITGEFYPLVYVLVACVAAFADKAVGTALVLAAVLFEAVLFFGTEHRTDPKAFAFHTVFVVFFGILNLLFTRAEIARVREHSRRERDAERRRVEEESRIFRLVSAPTAGAQKDDERLLRSSLAEVHNALYHTLELLKRSLELNTCVLLFLDESRSSLSIVELVTSSDEVGRGPFVVGAGAVGAVASRGTVMNLEHIKPGYRGLCYYDGPTTVRAFLGVPVMEGANIVGALCADRTDDRPFTPREEELVKLAAKQIVRITENERIFVQLEQSKHEQHTLYQASQALGAALTEDQVLDAGMDAIRDVTAFDFAAITLYD